MRPLALALALVLALPSAAATDHTSQGTPNEEPPGEQESLEEDEGASYGGAILIGMLVFAAVLGWASYRYRRRPPSRP